MNKFFPIVVLALLLSSCASREKILYVQNMDTNKEQAISNYTEIKIEPGDRLNIVVSCKDPELAAILNMPLTSFETGGDKVNTTNQIISYLVDNEGNIDFPIVGSIHLAGLTRSQARDTVSQKIKEAQLIQDFVVTINYSDMRVFLLGEVNSPGTYTINTDHVTIFQAISMAHDLTIYGRRDEVFVIREEGEKRINYQLDLRNDSVFSSPAYYLKQNDVVYVRPNKKRAGQTSVNANVWGSATLWLSIATVAATLYSVFK